MILFYNLNEIYKKLKKKIVLMNIHTFIDTLIYSESINDIIINIFTVHLAFLIGTFFLNVIINYFIFNER